MIIFFINHEFSDFIQNSGIQNPTINFKKLEITYQEINNNNESVQSCYSISNNF